MTATAPQHSLEWFRARLGCITGSCAGELVSRGRGAEFTQKGYTYLHTVAAERMIPSCIIDDDEALAAYLDEVSVTSKAMRIGTEREAEARLLYSEITGHIVDEAGAIPHPGIHGFASSPDGLVRADDGHIIGTVEIKCPRPATYFEYLSTVRTAVDLLRINATYYWQCVSHMAVTGAEWCDFIVYCPYNSLPLHIVRIHRDEAAILKLESRIRAALQYISLLLDVADSNSRVSQIPPPPCPPSAAPTS